MSWQDAGLPSAPRDVWNKVLDEDFKLLGTWDTTVQGALKAARNNEWSTCAYLAARCFQDANDSSEGAGAQALAAPDEEARRIFWRNAARPVVLDVPLGRERLLVHLNDGPEWIRTDQIECSFRSGADYKVQVHKRGIGILAIDLDRHAEFLNAGETVDMSYRAWLKSGDKGPAEGPAGAPHPTRNSSQSAWNTKKHAAAAAREAGTNITMRIVPLQTPEILQLRSFIAALPVRVSMDSANIAGVKFAPDAFCSCRLLSRQDSRVTTVIREGACQPVWKDAFTLESFEVGDSLVFELWDKRPDEDLLLGSITRALSDFEADFSGELQLDPGSEGDVEATLQVQITQITTKCAPAFLKQKADAAGQLPKITSQVPFGKYQVLAYPLGENFTKALLRPTKVDAYVLETLGETLVSQCAKAGQWDFVHTLLEAGVPMPDLPNEFASLCGVAPSVQRQWLHDLAAVGGGKAQSLVSLATRAATSTALRTTVEYMYKNGGLKSLTTGQPPLLARLVKERQWEMVQVLLETLKEECGSPDILPGVNLADLLLEARAPSELRALAREYQSEQTRMGPRALSLREYFERQLQGESVGESNFPDGYASSDRCLVRSAGEGDVYVLERAGRLCQNCWDGAGIVFARLSQEELEKASDAIDDDTSSMFPIDLSGKAIATSDKLAPGCWIAVFAPKSYWRESRVLRIPSGRFASPYIPRATVRVTTTTPCCGQRIGDVMVQVDGWRAGVTDDMGELELALPFGKHTIEAVEQGEDGPEFIDGQVVHVSQGATDLLDVKLRSNGNVYAYLLAREANPDSAEMVHQVMVIANKDNMPEGALPFKGIHSHLSLARSGKAVSPGGSHGSRPPCRPSTANRSSSRRPCERGGFDYSCAASKGACRRSSGTQGILAVQPGGKCDLKLHKLQTQLCRYAPESFEKRAMEHLSGSGLLATCFRSWAAFVYPHSQQPEEDVRYEPEMSFTHRTALGAEENECSLKRLNLPMRVGNLVTSVYSMRPGSATRATTSTSASSSKPRKPPLLKLMDQASSTRNSDDGDVPVGNILRAYGGHQNIISVCNRMAAQRAATAGAVRPSSAAPAPAARRTCQTRRANSAGRPTGCASGQRPLGRATSLGVSQRPGTAMREPKREPRPLSLRW